MDVFAGARNVFGSSNRPSFVRLAATSNQITIRQATRSASATMMLRYSLQLATLLCLQLLLPQCCQAFLPSTRSGYHCHSSRSVDSHTQLCNNNRVDKGFNLLEVASAVVPQGRIVKTAKESWKFLWKRFMTELAPQDQTGNYQRPTYGLAGTIGSIEFPVEVGRYHIYVVSV